MIQENWKAMEMKPWYRARTLQLLGNAVAGARADCETNQQELAATIGSSRPTISRLESGQGASAKTVLDALQACDYELIVVPRGSRVTVTPPQQTLPPQQELPSQHELQPQQEQR